MSIQDQTEQYSFGYRNPISVKQEIKTADGVVHGAELGLEKCFESPC